MANANRQQLDVCLRNLKELYSDTITRQLI